MDAMDDIAQQLKKEGFDVTGFQCDNKWKSLLKDYRETEDANARSGAGRVDPPSGSFGFEVHEAMGVMMGERASTRPKCVMGSGIPVSLDGDH